MKAYGSGCIDPHFLDLGTSGRRVVSFTPQPLYPRGKRPRSPLDRRFGGPQSRSGWYRVEKILDRTGTRTRYTEYAIPAPDYKRIILKYEVNVKGLDYLITNLNPILNAPTFRYSLANLIFAAFRCIVLWNMQPDSHRQFCQVNSRLTVLVEIIYCYTEIFLIFLIFRYFFLWKFISFMSHLIHIVNIHVTRILQFVILPLISQL
jgi:hypothetical protein